MLHAAVAAAGGSLSRESKALLNSRSRAGISLRLRSSPRSNDAFFCCIAVNFKILVANFTIFRHERLNVGFSFGAFKAIKKSLKKKVIFRHYPQIKIRANGVSRFLPAKVLVGGVR